MFLLPLCIALLVGGVCAQSASEAKYPTVFDAFNSWKTKYLETDEVGQSGKYQAIAVSARRLDDRSATVQLLILSESNDERGFDIKVSAQPMRIQKDVKGQNFLVKSGSGSGIEASGLKSHSRHELENVLAVPSLSLPADVNADAVSIEINIYDGVKNIRQTISVPLEYGGFATAIGRFADDRNELSEAEWCGSCLDCGTLCINCPDNKSGHFNCVNCTITCQ